MPDDIRTTPPPSRRYPWREACFIAGAYAFGASLWIIGSDRLAALIADGDPALLSKIDTFKGLFFVCVTAGMLFFGTLYVVRRRERLLAEQQRMQNLLAVSSKYESLGQLAGSLAHDFNNVLTVVQTSAELAQSGPPEEAGKMLATMRASVISAQSSIRHLLAFARSEPADFKVYDLAESLRNSLPLINGIVGIRINLQTHIPDTPVLVRGVHDLLVQGLLNLCANARDAVVDTPEKSVSVVLSVVHLERYTSPFRKEPATGDYAQLRISDTGCGIPPHVMMHLFTPLFTTKPAGQGTGLGLASALRAAQLHEGWIEVASAKARGASFSIFIPVHTAGA